MEDVTADMNANSRYRSTGEPQLDKAVQRWLSWDKNPSTRAQVEALLAEGHLEDLRTRLCSRMSFGTAGLRAPMGAGLQPHQRPDRDPVHAGLALVPVQVFPRPAQQRRGGGLRHQRPGGERLQQPAVGEANGCGDAQQGRSRPSLLHLRPHPVCAVCGEEAGGSGGSDDHCVPQSQRRPTATREVLCCVEEQLEPWSSSCWDEGLAETSSLRTDPLAPMNHCYMEELTSLCFHRDLNRRCPLKFVHSSFHGVGHDYVQEAFRTFGFTPPIPVPEQKDPDPNFSSVSCPNPEEGQPVLELSLLLAEKEGAPVVLATDPDADRLAVAEKADGCGWKVFTGNELAALLGWWMFSNWKDAHPDPAEVRKVYMLATTVSSKILQTLARAEGFNFEETLPGFKWIGTRIQELTQAGRTVLFSFEESIGFLCGSCLLDKDGVSSAAVVAEMASFLHSRNLTLKQQLDNIYQAYGYHLAKTSYVICKDPPTIKSIFNRIRNFGGQGSYPKTCSGVQIVHVRDVTTGYDSSQPDLRSVLPVMRSSHMITFTLQNGLVATLRTSGTEPKIKCYAEYCAAPGDSDVTRLEEELRRFVAALLDEFLEPEKNKLTRRHL
ncbi:unnamed protein product [Tetraodon nigroviridis]|uniref:(spotted green pufferfish) hypothetical protein n=1 Tax=Tetraodon nigroviridis TaxID=99883 RepID=Q4SB32_TETNG|nr:unnamed protein product [Tetraodon nigroviridis]